MARQPERLDACFKQGAKARQKRGNLADNPYDIETEEHREWAAGWSATFDLDEDEDPASLRVDLRDVAATRRSEDQVDGARPSKRRR